jgi:putative ABC transport system permease protein
VVWAGARLIRADVAARPLQAALTGLVIAIAAGALLATLHLRAVLDEPFEDLMRATNGAHLTVTGSPRAVARAAGVPDVAASRSERAAALPEVAAAGTPRAEVRVRSGRGRLTLAELRAGEAIDRPLIVSGRELRGPDEVVLERTFAVNLGLGPGDTVAAGDGRLAVVGVAAVVHNGPGGWITPGRLRAFARTSRDPPAVTVPLRLRVPAAAGAVAARIGAQPGVEVGDWLQAREDFTDESRRTLALLGVMTLLTLLGAGFTLATSIGGRVLAERRRIGLLRAVGVTPRGVTGVLVAHYVAVGVVAAPVGLAAGYLFSRPLVDDTSALLGTPAPAPPGAGLVAAAFAIVIAAVAAACALPAWRAGRLPPVVALQPVRYGATRPSRAARAARAVRLPMTAALGPKDAFAQRARAGLTMASLALAAIAVVCALAFEATMDRLASDPALRAQPWEVAAFGGEGTTPAEVDRLLREMPGVSEVGRLYDVPVVAGSTTLRARALDASPSTFAFAVPDGRGVAQVGEATLGRGALEALGARIGDAITLSAGGRPFAVEIVGRHVEPTTGGLGAVVLADTLPAPPSVRPTWVMRLDEGADPVRTQAEVGRLGGERLIAWRPAEAVEREVDDLRPIVYGLTALLLAIAGVNLLTTLVLGVRERRRDVAVLGAVGATRRQVSATIVAGGVLLALPSALVGLPLGAWTFATLIGITDPSDGPDVAALPAWWTVALALIGGLALVAAVSLLAAREAARVSVPVALRAE